MFCIESNLIVRTFFVLDPSHRDTWAGDHIEVSHKYQPHLVLPRVATIEALFLKHGLPSKRETVSLKQKKLIDVSNLQGKHVSRDVGKCK